MHRVPAEQGILLDIYKNIDIVRRIKYVPTRVISYYASSLKNSKKGKENFWL
jgi:hypothetical protein